jgi:hypothetical protein
LIELRQIGQHGPQGLRLLLGARDPGEPVGEQKSELTELRVVAAFDPDPTGRGRKVVLRSPDSMWGRDSISGRNDLRDRDP